MDKADLARRGVRIKPLEWTVEQAEHPERFHIFKCGAYTVYCSEWGKHISWRANRGGENVGYGKTSDEAKSQAQADHDFYVLELLDLELPENVGTHENHVGTHGK